MKHMKHLCFFAIAAGVAPLRIHALDLTPAAGFRDLEGVKIPVVFFQDEPRTVRWQPPAAWQWSGGGARLVLTPPGVPNAGMELRLIARKDADAPDGKADPKAAAEWVQPLLPDTFHDLKFTKENPSPFLLGGLNSRELNFTYTYIAREFTISVALVNLDLDHSLELIIYAPTAEFTPIHEEGTKSMFRWVWLSGSQAQSRVNARAESNAALEK